MGEVYRARDRSLKREVAIKILPEEFSQDADRVARFQREAEVLASLNHPNIAAIYDLAEANGSRYLVLELVEGETLADRLAHGPLALDDALNIAGHICDALATATEMGVILGTTAYMSPEQALGKAIDKRTEIWAFGCGLYEMLTGKQAFVGEDVPDTIAAVLRGTPDWDALPAGTPEQIRKLTTSPLTAYDSFLLRTASVQARRPLLHPRAWSLF